MPRLVDVDPLEYTDPPARDFIFMLRPYVVRIGPRTLRVRLSRVLVSQAADHVRTRTGLRRDRIELTLRLKVEFLARMRPSTMIFALIDNKTSHH